MPRTDGAKHTDLACSLEHREAHGGREPQPADHNHQIRHDSEKPYHHQQVVLHHHARRLDELARLDVESTGRQIGAELLNQCHS